MLFRAGFTRFALPPLPDECGTVPGASPPCPQHLLCAQPSSSVPARQQVTGSWLCSTTEFLSRGDFASSASLPWMLKAHGSFWLKSGLSVLSTYENQPWVFAQINNQCEHKGCGKPRSSFISGKCIAHPGFGGCGSWALAGHPWLHY